MTDEVQMIETPINIDVIRADIKAYLEDLQLRNVSFDNVRFVLKDFVTGTGWDGIKAKILDIMNPQTLLSIQKILLSEIQKNKMFGSKHIAILRYFIEGKEYSESVLNDLEGVEPDAPKIQSSEIEMIAPNVIQDFVDFCINEANTSHIADLINEKSPLTLDSEELSIFDNVHLPVCFMVEKFENGWNIGLSGKLEFNEKRIFNPATVNTDVQQFLSANHLRNFEEMIVTQKIARQYFSWITVLNDTSEIIISADAASNESTKNAHNLIEKITDFIHHASQGNVVYKRVNFQHKLDSSYNNFDINIKSGRITSLKYIGTSGAGVSATADRHRTNLKTDTLIKDGIDQTKANGGLVSILNIKMDWTSSVPNINMSVEFGKQKYSVSVGQKNILVSSSNVAHVKNCQNWDDFSFILDRLR